MVTHTNKKSNSDPDELEVIAEKVIELKKEKKLLIKRISELEAENAKLNNKINDIKRFISVAL